jgi:hypothetical protein
MEERDEAFEELIERSSLGAPGARQLRRRTSRSQVDAVRRIVDLRNRMFHGRGSEASQAAGALIRLFRELGYHGQAEHVLAEAFPGPEADTVLRAAEAIAGTAGRDSEVKVVDLTDEEPTSAAEAESLWRWLREEPELREHVHRVEQNPRPNRTGRDRPDGLVVAVAATTAAAAAAAAIAAAGPAVVIVAAGSVVPVFARVLVEWLRSRRSNITVTVTGPGGRQASLDAKSVRDPEHTLREVLGDQAT